MNPNKKMEPTTLLHTEVILTWPLVNTCTWEGLSYNRLLLLVLFLFVFAISRHNERMEGLKDGDGNLPKHPWADVGYIIKVMRSILLASLHAYALRELAISASTLKTTFWKCNPLEVACQETESAGYLWSTKVKTCPCEETVKASYRTAVGIWYYFIAKIVELLTGLPVNMVTGNAFMSTWDAVHHVAMVYLAREALLHAPGGSTSVLEMISCMFYVPVLLLLIGRYLEILDCLPKVPDKIWAFGFWLIADVFKLVHLVAAIAHIVLLLDNNFKCNYPKEGAIVVLFVSIASLIDGLYHYHGRWMRRNDDTDDND